MGQTGKETHRKMNASENTHHTAPAAEPGLSEAIRGGLATTAAFVAWGLLPVYWKAIQDVPALEILCHRIVWSLLFLTGLVAFSTNRGEIRQGLAQRSTRLLLLASSLALCANWLIYIWAVNTGHVLEASLGYFITPLVNVLLGMLFLGERLGRLQALAVTLAAVGVGYQILLLGALPWISLGLALSFGTYGLLRKKAPIGSTAGLFVETLFLGIPALGAIVLFESGGAGALGTGTPLRLLLLAGSGIVTSVPLLLFTFGARRINLATVGILQYVSPTISFCLGIFLFAEPFSAKRLVTFLFIWAALALYSADALFRTGNR